MTIGVLAEGSVRSVWVTETGIWNEGLGTYTEVLRSRVEKEIGVQLQQRVEPDRPPRLVVQFDGPTGYEGYLLEDMKDAAYSYTSDLCICAGTINRWPCCLVSVPDLRHFLEKTGYLGKELEP